MTTLFEDDAAGVPESDRVRFALIQAYAAELLADPPIAAVGLDRADRQAQALKFAAKDVQRMIRAATQAGVLMVRENAK